MTHDVVLPFRKAGHKSAVAPYSVAVGNHATALEVIPLSAATTEPICSSIARVDIDAVSVAIALRYLSGRLRVSMRTKRERRQPSGESI